MAGGGQKGAPEGTRPENPDTGLKTVVPGNTHSDRWSGAGSNRRPSAFRAGSHAPGGGETTATRRASSRLPRTSPEEGPVVDMRQAATPAGQTRTDTN